MKNFNQKALGWLYVGFVGSLVSIISLQVCLTLLVSRTIENVEREKGTTVYMSEPNPFSPKFNESQSVLLQKELFPQDDPSKWVKVRILE